MNLIGKILVVFIFAMTILFMGLALSVYSTQTNWRLVVENPEASQGRALGLRFQLENKEAEKAKIVEQKTKLQDELNAAKTTYQQQIAKLESERMAMQEQLESIENQLVTVQTQARGAVAEIAKHEADRKRLTDEVVKLRAEILAARNEADDNLKSARIKTVELNSAKGDIALLDERNKELVRQIVELKKENKNSGLGNGSQVDVSGLVTVVRKSNQDTLIEVSIGSDDGLKAGDTLEVFRGRNYLGRSRIIEITSDRAVGKMIPGISTGTVKKGDNVATKLKFS